MSDGRSTTRCGKRVPYEKKFLDIEGEMRTLLLAGGEVWGVASPWETEHGIHTPGLVGVVVGLFLFWGVLCCFFMGVLLGCFGRD